ncbi:hypothetical protein CYLTODRAFT_38800 [Cylindrobasidium torrendii FP15055 ss-10]|uniref:Uncharacterized protein n=1 Tax=Cylindrobasidium torrendii FP15055 ss-10 TaxID=1314674 RepID=A0A0D7B7W8_9AGAR|nr:hypothetical protein CYLTODRAFT_38800 [Cylindrobasidium torrendii FP15055 ss-10]
MDKDLPLKIRVDIRNLWDSPNSSLHKSIADLKATLGHTITPLAQWSLLWSELGDTFPDKTTFVPSIVATTTVWYDQLLARLDDEAWAEELLTILEGHGGEITLRVQPASDMSTVWDKKLRVFVLNVAAVEPHRVSAALEKSFDHLFSPAKVDVEDEDWADVKTPPLPSSRSGDTATLPTAADGTPTCLPTVDQLPRPSDLFASKAPYTLIVTAGHDRLEIQCSHEPSLQLLHDYLKKHAKVNQNDSLRRPIYTLALFESDFCASVMDTLWVEHTMKWLRSINPTLVLAFVESVLGYELVSSTASTWMYRRQLVVERRR